MAIESRSCCGRGRGIGGIEVPSFALDKATAGEGLSLDEKPRMTKEMKMSSFAEAMADDEECDATDAK